MDETELVIYGNTDMPGAHENGSSFAAVLAALAGLLAVLAAGGSISGEAAELLPMISATAVPGLIAWVLTYLYANSEIARGEEEVLSVG